MRAETFKSATYVRSISRPFKADKQSDRCGRLEYSELQTLAIWSGLGAAKALSSSRVTRYYWCHARII